jgi:hypothetical protein
MHVLEVTAVPRCSAEVMTPTQPRIMAFPRGSLKAATLHFRALKEQSMAETWTDEDRYWRNNYASRPYAKGTSYERLSPAYRYGYESASRYTGRSWEDVESDLERDWERYEDRGQSTWEQIKDAVRDAWDRVTGRQSRTI